MPLPHNTEDDEIIEVSLSEASDAGATVSTGPGLSTKTIAKSKSGTGAKAKAADTGAKTNGAASNASGVVARPAAG